MSNAMRRVANYLGLMDDPEFDTPQATTTNTPAIQPTGDVRIKTREPRSVGSLRQSSVVEVAPQLDLPAMDRIITLHPRYYNEAEHKRLVDFASGLAFGLHGTIERVTKKVFLLSPANVSVSSEDKSAAAQASFFNQS
jgi:cell division inhibitor SepF